jgi:folate-binding protein YgfZ
MLSLNEAYEAARDGGVWIARPRGLLRLTGPQRVWFLQNTITADVDDVASGSWIDSCFLDPKGRVVAYFRVGFLGEEIWIDADPASAEALGEWFVKYRFRTKVDIETVAQPSVTVLGTASGVEPGTIVSVGEGVAFGFELAGVRVTDVHGDAPVADVAEGPPELYDVLRIEAGAGSFGVDFGPSDLPQEAGLTRVLSVDKGCYVGQETIARIHFRGHVNRVLRTLAFDGAPAQPGSKLLWNDSPAGRVTSVAASPRTGAIGLGMVRVEPPEGATLTVEGGGRATVGAVPEGTKVAK